MLEQLNQALFDFGRHDSTWEQLVHQAEYHGIAPLLYNHLRHIGFTLPDGCHRILRSLHQRAKLSNHIRNKIAADIIKKYHHERIDVLAIKGIALGNHAYGDPSSRPMRDIDLLVRQQDLDMAQNLLREHGFLREKTHNIPDDYYHLPPLVKIVESLPISIELHNYLLPLDGNHPIWQLDKSFDSSMSITIGDAKTATLSLEENLHYLYLHGLRAPLSYEPFRFIHIADIVCLVERYFKRIDWRLAQTEFPQLSSILSRLHFVTPWPDAIINDLALDISRTPKNIGDGYSGWPLVKLRDTSALHIPLLTKETIWPPQWWTQVYYGQMSGSGYFKVRLFEHPRAVWRWLKGTLRQRWSNEA